MSTQEDSKAAPAAVAAGAVTASTGNVADGENAFLFRLGRWLEFYYPFTITGSILFLSALYLAGLAFGTSNIYAFLFSALSFLLLFVLAFDGRLQAMRLQTMDVVWEARGGLIARQPEAKQSLHLGEARPHYFYRFHFVIRGTLKAGRNATFLIREEGSSSRGGEIDIPVYFPLCGPVDVTGRLLLRDVFGFTRTRIGRAQPRRFVVQPPLLADKPLPQFRNAASFESSQRFRNSDEEKYYMREYQPGDRLKDLNWKASFRFGEMITRISPKSPEESKLLHLEFRHFHPGAVDTPAALMHLNFLKSWLLAFLFQVKREFPEFRFRVVTADEVYLVESEDDIERFGETLAAIPFVRGKHVVPVAGSGERFVFSTPFDTGLNDSIVPGVIFNIFRTNFPSSSEARRVRLLPMEQEHLPIPGPWIFRRESARPAPSVQGGGRFMEEKLKVSLV